MSKLICSVRQEHIWTSSERTKSWWCKRCYTISPICPFEKDHAKYMRYPENKGKTALCGCKG